MGEKRGAYRVWVGDLRKRNHLEDLGIGGRIILKWIFIKLNGEYFAFTFTVAYIRCLFIAICVFSLV